MKNIKMIMSDIDGTLVGNQYKVVTPRTINAIKQAKEKGILFGLATGRPVLSCENSLEKWGIDGLVDIIVGLNGGHIKDYKLHTDQVYYPLDGKYMLEIMEHFKDFDITFCVYKDGRILASRNEYWVEHLSISDHMPLDIVDIKEVCNMPQSKLVFVCNPKDMQKIQAHCDSFSSEHYRGFQTGDDLFEYMDARISKSGGIKEVAKSHNLSVDEVLAFGDANNDYEMVRDCGVGVVLENGSELTKSVADYISDDTNHDGVGTFIESYLLK